MLYVTREQIAKAKQMDLLTYFQMFEPQELVHVQGEVYSTRAHDSLKISNGKVVASYRWQVGVGLPDQGERHGFYGCREISL